MKKRKEIRRKIITISAMVCVAVCFVGSMKAVIWRVTMQDKAVSESEMESSVQEPMLDEEVDMVDQVDDGEDDIVDKEEVVIEEKDCYVEIDIKEMESEGNLRWSITDEEKVTSAAALFQEICHNAVHEEVWGSEGDESMENVLYRISFRTEDGTEMVYELSERTLRNTASLRVVILSEEQFRELRKLLESLE